MPDVGCVVCASDSTITLGIEISTVLGAFETTIIKSRRIGVRREEFLAREGAPCVDDAAGDWIVVGPSCWTFGVARDPDVRDNVDPGDVNGVEEASGTRGRELPSLGGADRFTRSQSRSSSDFAPSSTRSKPS